MNVSVDQVVFPAVYGKPVLHPSSTPPSPLPFVPAGCAFPLLQGGDDAPDGGELLDERECFQYAEPAPPPPSVENIPRPLSPTKLTPMVHSPLRYQSDADLELLRRKLANAPRPLKKRSSITEPEGPSGPNIQKLLYQRFNTLAGGMEGSVGSPGGGAGGGGGGGNGTPFYQPANPPGYPGGDSAADTDNGNLPTETPLPLPPGTEEAGLEAPPSSTDPNDNQPLPPEVLADAEGPEDEDDEEDDNNNNLGVMSEVAPPSPLPEEEGVGGVGTQLLVRDTLRKHLMII